MSVWCCSVWVARRYSVASCCSLSSGTDMKIFWQNMVKISEERQLITLIRFVVFHWVTACQILSEFYQTLSQHLGPRPSALTVSTHSSRYSHMNFKTHCNGRYSSSAPANRGGHYAKTKVSHSPSIFLTTWGFFHLYPSRYAGMPVRIMLLPTRHSNGAAQKDTAIMKMQLKTKPMGMKSGNCGEKYKACSCHTRVDRIRYIRQKSQSVLKTALLIWHYHHIGWCKTVMMQNCIMTSL